MDRIKIKYALEQEAGSKIIVKGWVRAFRSNRFIALNDGSTINNIQIVIDTEKLDETIVSQISTGAAIAVTGDLVESQGKGQKVEVVANEIEILGTANPEEVQKTILQPKNTV